MRTCPHDASRMEDCTSFGQLGADRSRSVAQVGQVAQCWPASSASRKFQAQSAAGDSTKQQQKSAWDVPLLHSPSRPPDRVSAEATEEVHRLEAALGEGNPLAKPLLEALRIARSKTKVLGANHCVQEFRRTSKEKSESGGGSHLQSPRTEGGVREGGAGKRSAIAAIGGIAFPTHRDAAASVTELQRRIDDLTRERDSLRAATPRVLPGVWMAEGPPVVESIPPIPKNSVQDIEGC